MNAAPIKRPIATLSIGDRVSVYVAFFLLLAGATTFLNVERPSKVHNTQHATAASVTKASYNTLLQPEFKYKGYIISINDTRYSRTAGILGNYNIAASLITPPSTNASIFTLNKEFTKLNDSDSWKRMWQLTYAHKKALLALAHDPDIADDGWGMVLEDDCNIHKNVSSEQFAAALDRSTVLAKESGFIYLGMCFPCEKFEDSLQHKEEVEDNIVLAQLDVSKCSVFCTHAYAVQKQRALWLYDEFDLHCDAVISETPDVTIVDHYFLCGMQHFAPSQQPWLLGSGLTDINTYPELSFGVVFQDDVYFGKSTLPHADVGSLGGSTESHYWILHPKVFDYIANDVVQKRFGRNLTIDLFADDASHKLDMYYSKNSSVPGVKNAFQQQNWTLYETESGELVRHTAYCFPPFKYMDRVVKRIVSSQTDAVILFPHAPAQTWYKQLDDMQQAGTMKLMFELDDQLLQSLGVSKNELMIQGDGKHLTDKDKVGKPVETKTKVFVGVILWD